MTEGVETADALVALVEMGCDAAQGFFLARPVDAAALTGAAVGATRWLAGRARTPAPPTDRRGLERPSSPRPV